MPAFREVRDQLKLNDEKAKTIDAWLAEAPKKKKELKLEVIAIRSELREAMLSRDSRIKHVKH